MSLLRVERIRTKVDVAQALRQDILGAQENIFEFQWGEHNEQAFPQRSTLTLCKLGDVAIVGEGEEDFKGLWHAKGSGVREEWLLVDMEAKKNYDSGRVESEGTEDKIEESEAGLKG